VHAKPADSAEQSCLKDDVIMAAPRVLGGTGRGAEGGNDADWSRAKQ
jgi:hypothetical protein